MKKTQESEIVCLNKFYKFEFKHFLIDEYLLCCQTMQDIKKCCYAKLFTENSSKN